MSFSVPEITILINQWLVKTLTLVEREWKLKAQVVVYWLDIQPVECKTFIQEGCTIIRTIHCCDGSRLRMRVNMKENEDCPPITNLGFTIICCVLSGVCVLCIVLLVVIIKSSLKKKRKPSAFRHHQSSLTGNDINTQEFQYGVHYSQRPIAFPGNPASFAHRRHLRDSTEHFSDVGVQRNAESFTSRHIPVATFLNEANARSDVSYDVNRSSPVTVDDNIIGLFDHAATQGPLKDLYSVTDRSFTQTVCGKLLVSIARHVYHKGDVLYLDNMGISLHVPEGAVDVGKKQLIVLVLNWDLSDNPTMQKEESLVSPVVYVGPHGMKLNKPCTLTFRHCAFDPRQIKIMRSETELNDMKSWEAMCDRDDVTGSCYLTPDECQLQIDTFTLFTCVQAPLDNVIGKKWLQLAVFACPLRHDVNHHQMRIYFLNKTNCALQWAIQNEAKFGGKLVCPEKAFLFDGSELDMITESMYVSEGWELVDDQNTETIAFVKIWHGQCPHISVCFRRTPKKSKSSPSKKSALEINLKLFAYQTSLKEIGEMIVAQMFENKLAGGNMIGVQCNHNTNIQVINYNNSSKSDDADTPQCETRSIQSDESSNTGSMQCHTENHKHTPVKVVVVNKTINTVPEPRASNICDTRVTKHIPHDLRKQLAIMLDPTRSPIGNDWRDLAAKLGMEEFISSLESYGHPTDSLLNKVEERDIGLVELKVLLEQIERDDCAREVSKYIQQSNSADIPIESSKEPTENEYTDSGFQRSRNLHSEEASWKDDGRRNLQTEESSWNDATGRRNLQTEESTREGTTGRRNLQTEESIREGTTGRRNLQTEESSWNDATGRRNLQTEESPWTESSGFKSTSLPSDNLTLNVHSPRDIDMTLSKTLFSNESNLFN